MKHRIHLPESAFDGGSPQHVRLPSGGRFTFRRGETPELDLSEVQVKELDAAGYICEPIRAAAKKQAKTYRRRKRSPVVVEAPATEED